MSKKSDNDDDHHGGESRFCRRRWWVLMGGLHAAAHVAINRVRTRMRVARARRILDLENTRRRYLVIGLLIAWWLAGIGAALAVSVVR